MVKVPAPLTKGEGSKSSTPGPTLEAYNYAPYLKPYKNHAAKARPRPRNLKQILATEREATLSDAALRRKKKKPIKGGAKAAAKLAGAAAVAAARGAAKRKAAAMEAEEETESSAAQANTTADQSMDATPAAEDGDVTMEDVGDASVTAAEAEEKQQRKDVPNYFSVEAPPSLRPRKKMCDVTGLNAPYTDPKSGLRYHSVEIFKLLRTFGPGVDQAYLALRGDSSAIV